MAYPPDSVPVQIQPVSRRPLKPAPGPARTAWKQQRVAHRQAVGKPVPPSLQGLKSL